MSMSYQKFVPNIYLMMGMSVVARIIGFLMDFSSMEGNARATTILVMGMVLLIVTIPLMISATMCLHGTDNRIFRIVIIVSTVFYVQTCWAFYTDYWQVVWYG